MLGTAAGPESKRKKKAKLAKKRILLNVCMSSYGQICRVYNWMLAPQLENATVFIRHAISLPKGCVIYRDMLRGTWPIISELTCTDVALV